MGDRIPGRRLSRPVTAIAAVHRRVRTERDSYDTRTPHPCCARAPPAAAASRDFAGVRWMACCYVAGRTVRAEESGGNHAEVKLGGGRQSAQYATAEAGHGVAWRRPPTNGGAEWKRPTTRGSPSNGTRPTWPLDDVPPHVSSSQSPRCLRKETQKSSKERPLEPPREPDRRRSRFDASSGPDRRCCCAAVTKKEQQQVRGRRSAKTFLVDLGGRLHGTCSTGGSIVRRRKSGAEPARLVPRIPKTANRGGLAWLCVRVSIHGGFRKLEVSKQGHIAYSHFKTATPIPESWTYSAGGYMARNRHVRTGAVRRAPPPKFLGLVSILDRGGGRAFFRSLRQDRHVPVFSPSLADERELHLVKAAERPALPLLLGGTMMRSVLSCPATQFPRGRVRAAHVVSCCCLLRPATARVIAVVFRHHTPSSSLSSVVDSHNRPCVDTAVCCPPYVDGSRPRCWLVFVGRPPSRARSIRTEREGPQWSRTKQ